MNSRQHRRDIRRKNFQQLRPIRTALYESDTLHLSQSDLTTLGIKWSEMDLQSESELGSGPRFCTPFPSDAIDRAFDKVFIDEAYEDVGQPEWPRYTPELQNTFYSALQIGLNLLRYLGCRSYDWSLIASTKWDRTG